MTGHDLNQHALLLVEVALLVIGLVLGLLAGLALAWERKDRIEARAKAEGFAEGKAKGLAEGKDLGRAAALAEHECRPRPHRFRSSSTHRTNQTAVLPKLTDEQINQQRTEVYRPPWRPV